MARGRAPYSSSSSSLPPLESWVSTKASIEECGGRRCSLVVAAAALVLGLIVVLVGLAVVAATAKLDGEADGGGGGGVLHGSHCEGLFGVGGLGGRLEDWWVGSAVGGGEAGEADAGE